MKQLTKAVAVGEVTVELIEVDKADFAVRCIAASQDTAELSEW
jgi:hypothetical protein